MTEPILSRSYWRQRLLTAKHPHHAIYLCSLEEWQRIEAKHREILRETIKPQESILDLGCGWGRLLTLLPQDWQGAYLGLDLSPEFIELARAEFSGKTFQVRDIRRLESLGEKQFDWGIMISIKGMILNNLCEETWRLIEQQTLYVCNRLLILEYSDHDDGTILPVN